MRAPLLALLLFVSSGLAATEASQASEATEPAQRHTCLIRLAEAQPLAAGEEVRARARRGDARATLIQRQGTALRLGPVASGTGCVLRFGVGIDPSGAGRGPLRVRVSAERNGHPPQVVFEESLRWQDGLRAAWIDREVALPSAGYDALHLVFEALTGAGGDESAVGWGSPHVVCGVPRPASPEPPTPHVILISIDTLRADHLGAYGYTRATSPNLDALAEESLVFENAFATSPWTLPSHASMLTGLYPDEHRAGHAHLHAGLAPGVATLAELLAAAGYRTIGNTAAGYVSSSQGLARGFQDWTERENTSLRSALPGVLDALGADPATPTFLFLHTYDVHGPYVHPEAYDRFGPSCEAEPCAFEPQSAEEREQWARLGAMKLHAHLELGRFRDVDGVIAAYDASVLFVDSQLGILFDHLRRSGMYEHALIIVTSDHGESFLERGSYISHGYTFFDEEMRVPLIVRQPGAASGGRSDDLVDLTDVASLILEAAGITPKAAISGASPLARMAGRAPQRVFVRGGTAFTGGVYARTRAWKVIAAVEPIGAMGLLRPASLIPSFEHAEQVFDLANDPQEQINRASDNATLPAPVWLLRQKLGEIEPPGREKASRNGLSSEQLEQLRALGYVAAPESP